MRIFEKCPNRPPFSVCKVCRNLLFFLSGLLIQFHQASSFSEQSHLSRKLSEISSRDHRGNTTLFNSLCSICRLSLGSICRLPKHSYGYTGFLRRRGLHWSFVASQRIRLLGKRCGVWRFLVCVEWSSLGPSTMLWNVSTCCGLQ